MALTGLIPLLIQSGPTLIRSIGSLFGRDGEQAASKAADLVEAVGNLAEPRAHAYLKDQLATLPPAQQQALLAMQTKLESIKAEREKNRLQFEHQVHQETQTTIRHGDTDGNPYVKETRPLLARLSTYGALLYVFLCQGLSVAGEGSGVDWAVLSAIYSPALTYMGMRTADKFSIRKPVNQQL